MAPRAQSARSRGCRNSLRTQPSTCAWVICKVWELVQMDYRLLVVMLSSLNQAGLLGIMCKLSIDLIGVANEGRCKVTCLWLPVLLLTGGWLLLFASSR